MFSRLSTISASSLRKSQVHVTRSHRFETSALQLPSPTFLSTNAMSKRRTSHSHEPRSKMNFFSNRSTDSTSLVSFYDGTGRDHRGRRLSEILQWGTGRLESSHDYIQTLFPLPEESGVNWNAPIIDRQVFNSFRSRPELRKGLRDSFEKMLWFYGFKLEAGKGEIKVSKGDNYESNSDNWDTRFDHNHLRITRIIRSLRVLGLEDEAKAFYTALQDSTTLVSFRSREFWRRAAERDLNLRPDLEIDDESDNTIGPMFLREYEVERKEKGLAKTGNDANVQDQGELQNEVGHQREQDEKKGLVDLDQSSDTQDEIGLGIVEEHQVEQVDKTGLVETGHDADARLETTQGHEATRNENENSTS